MRVKLALILCLSACTERTPRSPPATPTHSAPRSPPLSFGPQLLPPAIARVRLGMTEEELRAARPLAYPSGARTDLWHEELANDLSVHYGLARGRLASVLLRQDGRSADAGRLLAEAERRWGRPTRFLEAPLFRAPGALVRVEADMGNLILEYTDASSRTVRP